ncbi:MAG: RNA-binding S4 domain-containing protein [Eubacteriales bacterium]|jgi:ribosomal 50S subunit-recycling heat shock protein
MRLDKFLKVSRIIKRRTVASEACGNQYISVNGKPAKASYVVRVGDIITVSYGSRNVSFRVKEINENAPKDKAAEMYEVLEGDPFGQP